MMKTAMELQSLSIVLCLALWSSSSPVCHAFVPSHATHARTTSSFPIAAALIDEETDIDTKFPPASVSMDDERRKQKKILLGLLDPQPTKDPVLADPITKEPIIFIPKAGTYFGTYAGQGARRTTYELKTASGSETYGGSSSTFFNLLEPQGSKSQDDDTFESSDDVNNNNSNSQQLREQLRETVVRNVTPLIPPPLRSALATAGVLVGDNYVPMRDLFTSPAVSYAYERGWRQNFRSAGFPGEDEEAKMAMDYFAPSMAKSDDKVIVDMSCATGLFTRRFAASQKYKRVLGCDYSPSMLQEARRRIQADASLRNMAGLELVRLDVGQIPMQDDSIDALHAGAAMHCWPDLPAAVSEIHRVLKPGGRYFATTFLSSWFGMLQQSEGGATGPSRQAFQYFESVEVLRRLMVEDGGFDNEKVNIEILAPSCVVIRCEK